MDTNEFHKVWVIESLEAGKAGRRLVEGPLFQAELRHEHLQVAYEAPKTKMELLQTLAKIRDEALHEGIWPMIHFECHGSPSGLMSESGEFLTWEEVRGLLIQINQACKLNLNVVIAACNGAHLINVATRLDRAPFFAAIGPTSEVSAGPMEENFGAFYTAFFDRLSGDAAMAALNQGKVGRERHYHFFTAFGLFARAYRKYQDNHCTGKGKLARTEVLLTRALAHPEIRTRGVNAVRKEVKQQLTKEDQYFDSLRDRFFFIDQFPENADRFGYSREEVLEFYRRTGANGTGAKPT